MTEWNDDRLDELNERVKDGFAKVGGEMNRRFGELDMRFEGIDKRLDRIDRRFEAFEGQLNRVLNTLLAAALGFGGTVLVAVLGFLASQALRG